MRSRSNTWSGGDGASNFVSEIDDSESICSSVDPSNPDAQRSTPYPSTVSLPGMENGRAAAPHLQLTSGAYVLHRTDEQRLQTDILKFELSKVDNLIRAFAQRHTGEGSQTQYEAKVNEDMVSFLQKRLRDSLEMLGGQERYR